MSLTNREGAVKLRKEVQEVRQLERGETLTRDIVQHFNALHSKNYYTDKKIEQQLIKDELEDLDSSFSDIGIKDGIIMFSPSSSSKCERELFLKATKAEKDEIQAYPYQKRWTRNSTAVHRAVQKDLLYAEKLLKSPKFKVKRTSSGSPAWEKNIAKVVQLEYKGIPFQLYGMMDGILDYYDGSTVGFEFKTKSTTIAAIGAYKMKEASPDHVMQCSAYSILFGVDEFIILYESVAKDGWNKGKDAKPDLRPFYIKVTDEDREHLLQKFARVAEQYYNGEIPRGNYDKCLFCTYKTRCDSIGL